MARKFYKTTFRIEVLSEGELPDFATLGRIEEAFTTGDCSGVWTEELTQPLTPREAAQALLDQGSDPGFFQLDDDGNDVE